MKIIAFLERIYTLEEIKLYSGSDVLHIALTPMVCNILSNNGVTYSIPDDYFDFSVFLKVYIQDTIPNMAPYWIYCAEKERSKVYWNCFIDLLFINEFRPHKCLYFGDKFLLQSVLQERGLI